MNKTENKHNIHVPYISCEKCHKFYSIIHDKTCPKCKKQIEEENKGINEERMKKIIKNKKIFEEYTKKYPNYQQILNPQIKQINYQSIFIPGYQQNFDTIYLKPIKFM